MKGDTRSLDYGSYATHWDLAGDSVLADSPAKG